MKQKWNVSTHIRQGSNLSFFAAPYFALVALKALLSCTHSLSLPEAEPGLFLFVNLVNYLANHYFFAFFSFFVDSFETQKGGVPQVVKQVANLSCLNIDILSILLTPQIVSCFVDSFETQKGGVPQVVKQVANL